MSTHEFLGVQFEQIRRFMESIHLQVNNFNDQRIVNVLKEHHHERWQATNKKNIALTLRKYKDHLVFLERDKNANSWTVTCQQFYVNVVQEHLNDKTLYIQSEEIAEDHKLVIKTKIDRANVKLIKNKKKWDLGFGYLLPKDKDIMRWRPIVSYFHCYTKGFGNWIGRALSVVIRTLKLHWKTIEMYDSKDFMPWLAEINNSDRWQK